MSTAYSAQFQIDQPDGAGSGSPGIARTDLWRATRVNLTPTASPPGATHQWSLVRPRGSTAQFLDPLTGLPNPDCATPYILQDKWGSYLIQHSVNNGAYTSQMIAAVKFDDDGTLLKLGWRYPALNEGWLDASDPDGWKKPLEDIFDSLYGVISSLENHGGYYGDDGGERRFPCAGRAVQDDGTDPVGLDGTPEQLARCEDVALPDEFVEVARTHPGGQRGNARCGRCRRFGRGSFNRL